MHAAFELAHVDGGPEVRVTTAVFGTVKRLSQKRQQIDKQNQHNILRSAIWSMAYRHERARHAGFQACIRCGTSNSMDGRVVLRLDAG
jgi:hypothetical protein